MVNVEKSLYKDYEMILIKNDELSQENRDIKYINGLLDKQIKTLEKKDNEIELENKQLELSNKQLEKQKRNGQ